MTTFDSTRTELSKLLEEVILGVLCARHLFANSTQQTAEN